MYNSVSNNSTIQPNKKTKYPLKLRVGLHFKEIYFEATAYSPTTLHKMKTEGILQTLNVAKARKGNCEVMFYSLKILYCIFFKSLENYSA